MDREEVITLLEKGRFRNKPISGKLVETHISWVILTREYVFKIKKPMKYSFLDFSTLEKRKHFCQQEIDLNRRLTSGIYLDVLQILENKGSLYIGKAKSDGPEKVLDHVVFMRRLQTAKEMDRVMKAGNLTRMHMDRLTRKIADFHIDAVIIKKRFSLNAAIKEFNDIQTVADWVSSELGSTYSDRIKRVIDYSDKYLKEHQHLFKTRIREGFQRDVHGDLHARNIFLYKDPVIFDCIEFNDDFRRIDVLKEIAYFCMDLDAFGCQDLSRYFIHQYNQLFPAIRSNEEWRLFYYYKCYRANVRAKVNALRAMQALDDGDLQRFKAEVKKYVLLMEGYFSL